MCRWCLWNYVVSHRVVLARKIYLRTSGCQEYLNLGRLPRILWVFDDVFLASHSGILWFVFIFYLTLTPLTALFCGLVHNIYVRHFIFLINILQVTILSRYTDISFITFSWGLFYVVEDLPVSFHFKFSILITVDHFILSK